MGTATERDALPKQAIYLISTCDDFQSRIVPANKRLGARNSSAAADAANVEPTDCRTDGPSPRRWGVTRAVEPSKGAPLSALTQT
jgi:hypothetical protein